MLGRAATQRHLAAKRGGTYALQFVCIGDDGTARELTPDEIEYLNTDFHPADGARPYIKARYRTLTPDGKIGGFLSRRKLPRHVKVKPHSSIGQSRYADAQL